MKQRRREAERKRLVGRGWNTRDRRTRGRNYARVSADSRERAATIGLSSCLSVQRFYFLLPTCRHDHGHGRHRGGKVATSFLAAAAAGLRRSRFINPFPSRETHRSTRRSAEGIVPRTRRKFGKLNEQPKRVARD